ncbi:MAG: heparinase II/III family protein, partial [Gemmatimonadota bacterium]|nr:heparinase II/III family protein [Gemmatimonadota bacterium]
LDAGYINFDNHDKVNKGRNHNVVLVDGKGPPRRRTFPVARTIGDRNDAFIEGFFTSAVGDYAEVRAAYRGVELRRRVFFADHRYFLMADEIDDPGRRHTYEWRLHGNGGGTSGGAYARAGNLARWTRDKAELLAFLPEQPGRVALESEAIHSFDYRQEQTHAMLRVQQEGVDGRYLAVLYPRMRREARPAFETISAQGAEAALVALAGVRDVAWLRSGNASEATVSGPDASLVSDARFGYVRYVDGQLIRFVAQDATYLLADGETVFRASGTIDVSLERDDYAGFVRGPDAGYQLRMPHLGNEWSAARFLGGAWWSTAVEGEMLVLELAGEGTLELGADQHVEAQKGVLPRPERYALHPNAPNPFNPTTKIRFDLPASSLVQLTVYNVLGQQVERLVERRMPPGRHEVEWDASGYRSGLYFYALKADSYRAQHKMILLR